MSGQCYMKVVGASDVVVARSTAKRDLSLFSRSDASCLLPTRCTPTPPPGADPIARTLTPSCPFFSLCRTMTSWQNPWIRVVMATSRRRWPWRESFLGGCVHPFYHNSSVCCPLARPVEVWSHTKHVFSRINYCIIVV